MPGHYLDNWDKHRLLTLVAVPSASFRDPQPEAAMFVIPLAFAHISGGHRIETAELGAIVARMKLPGGMRLRDMDMTGYLDLGLNTIEEQLDVITLLGALA